VRDVNRHDIGGGHIHAARLRICVRSRKSAVSSLAGSPHDGGQRTLRELAASIPIQTVTQHAPIRRC